MCNSGYRKIASGGLFYRRFYRITLFSQRNRSHYLHPNILRSRKLRLDTVLLITVLATSCLRSIGWCSLPIGNRDSPALSLSVTQLSSMIHLHDEWGTMYARSTRRGWHWRSDKETWMAIVCRYRDNKPCRLHRFVPVVYSNMLQYVSTTASTHSNERVWVSRNYSWWK